MATRRLDRCPDPHRMGTVGPRMSCGAPIPHRVHDEGAMLRALPATGRVPTVVNFTTGGGGAMTIPESVRALIAIGPLAHLTTLNSDGSPHVTVVWVAVEGDDIVSAHL